MQGSNSRAHAPIWSGLFERWNLLFGQWARAMILIAIDTNKRLADDPLCLHRARVGQRVRALVDGPSADHDLVWRGRLQGQAPDIDPQVYFTECDPSTLRPGTFVTAEIVEEEE